MNMVKIKMTTRHRNMLTNLLGETKAIRDYKRSAKRFPKHARLFNSIAKDEQEHAQKLKRALRLGKGKR